MQWGAPEVSIRQEIKYLGVVRANPVEYTERYGSSLRSADQLPKIVTQIQNPCGIILAADQPTRMVPELEGEIEALKLIDLEAEGLGEYKSIVYNTEKVECSEKNTPAVVSAPIISTSVAVSTLVTSTPVAVSAPITSTPVAVSAPITSTPVNVSAVISSSNVPASIISRPATSAQLSASASAAATIATAVAAILGAKSSASTPASTSAPVSVPSSNSASASLSTCSSGVESRLNNALIETPNFR